MRKMKDSGVQWIGEIPDNWTISRFRYLGTWSSGATPSKAQTSYWDGETNWVSSREVKGDFLTTTSFQISDTAIQASNLRKWGPGTLVMVTRSGILQHTIPVALLAMGATINQDVKAFSPSGLATVAFVKYFINGSNDLLLTLSSNEKTTVDSLDSQRLNDVPVPLPPILEQQRIADFLDARSAEIDTLRSQIERQIGVLESYKRSVITEAVTRGLYPAVQMKDSGDSWLSSIPVGWRLERAKYLFEERKSKGNSVCLQVLSPTQQYGVIPQSQYDEISGMSTVKLKENFDLNELKTIHQGDFCISLRSFQGGFEYSEYEGVVSPAYHVFYPVRKVFSGYFRYLFKEETFVKKMNSYTLSLRDGKNISFADLGRTFIPVPPLVEQRQIATYLDEKVSAVDGIISLKQEQLAKLAEYKKSLIFEYVTGKKEVPS